jgi:hypothetical protein
MKKYTLAFRLSLVGILIALFSFSGKKGGDSFEILLNGKLLLQQFVSQAKGVQNISLSQSNKNDRIDIYYSHCGQTGKNRTIVIKDEKNNLLKEWHYADVAGKSPMSCTGKDIFTLQKNTLQKLNLYYASKELPKGRLLATVTVQNDKVASIR